MVLRTLASLEDTAKLAADMAAVLPVNQSIWLCGPLGVGKTAFARCLLQAEGVERAVRSPSYSLIESYDTQNGAWHHLDLYRLSDPEELEYLGFYDLQQTGARFLIEWPSRAEAMLPSAYAKVDFEFCEAGRSAALSGPIVQQLASSAQA